MLIHWKFPHRLMALIFSNFYAFYIHFSDNYASIHNQKVFQHGNAFKNTFVSQSVLLSKNQNDQKFLSDSIALVKCYST